MASYFKLVEDRERRAYFNAGLLYFKYEGECDYRKESFLQWEHYRDAWNTRHHVVPPWDSYILVEDDTEEAACPSP